MPKLVVNGAKLKCDQGLAPSSLSMLPAIGSAADDQPAGTDVVVAMLIFLS